MPDSSAYSRWKLKLSGASSAMEGSSEEPDYLTAPGTEHARSDSYLPVFSANSESIAESLDMGGRSTMPYSSVEEQIEQSKPHWSTLAESYSDPDDEEVAEVSNVEVFKALQSKWGNYSFYKFNDGDGSTLRVGEKFTEGGQAELFHAKVTWGSLEVNDKLRETETLVLKVFKKGTFLRDLQPRVCYELQQFPAEVAAGSAETWPPRYIEQRPRSCSAVNLGTLLADGRFAYLMVKKDEDLRTLIERNMYLNSGKNDGGPFAKEDAEYLIYCVALGVHVLHGVDIVHRDVKASNVLVRENNSGYPKWECLIADYECSIGVVGTGFFRAPEILQALKDQNLSQKPELFCKKADVYSYGMTCYEILTGKLPFGDHPLNDYDLVLNGLRPEVPEYVEDWTRELLNRCWHPNPGDRPTIGEIVKMLISRQLEADPNGQGISKRQTIKSYMGVQEKIKSVEPVMRSMVGEFEAKIDEHGSPPLGAVRSENTDELISKLNVKEQPKEQEQCAEEQEYKGGRAVCNFRKWFQVLIQVMAASLLYSFWVYILIKPFIMLLALIESIATYIPFPGFSSFLVALFVWKYIPSEQERKVVWKYKYFWRLLGIIFKSNVNLALKFADFVRKAIPHFAPCNALQDDVTCSAITSKYVARTHGDREPAFPGLRQYPIVALDHHSKETFSSQVFQIGAGVVRVMKPTEDQFRFRCEVREEVLEDFVAITDWESMAIILSIIEFWKTSPEVGVIGNLIHRGEGVYCHALNIKEIVEGVHESLHHFSIFQLQEAKQFFVGCGRGDVSMSNEKADQDNKSHLTTSTILGVVIAVGVYFQLKDNYNKIATASLVILSGVAILIFFLDFFGLLFKKSCFYWICTLLCCFSKNWRLGIYLWLKKRNFSLAYCDEFRPDQLQLLDSTTEVIYLFKSLYVTREAKAVNQIPDWAAFGITDMYNLGLVDAWRKQQIGAGGPFFLFKLFTDSNNLNDVIFRMDYPYSNCIVESKRTVVATSTWDRSPAGHLTGTMTTEVSVDGRAETYQWPSGSFYLFVYLMLKWRMMNQGVIKNCEDFMFKSYYHVFSTHGLAAHIEKLKLDYYYLLLGV